MTHCTIWQPHSDTLTACCCLAKTVNNRICMHVSWYHGWLCVRLLPAMPVIRGDLPVLKANQAINHHFGKLAMTFDGTASTPLLSYCRRMRMLMTGFESFCHNSNQSHQLQCVRHSQQRLFARWRRSVQSRAADWISHGPCLATIRRRLHLKGWLSEQQWHLHYETRR